MSQQGPEALFLPARVTERVRGGCGIAYEKELSRKNPQTRASLICVKWITTVIDVAHVASATGESWPDLLDLVEYNLVIRGHSHT